MWYAGRRMSRRRRGHSVDFVERERDARARVCGSRMGVAVVGLVPGGIDWVIVWCQRRYRFR